MGLLDKLKSTFFEEEYVEVEEKPKREPIAKKVESKKEEKKEVRSEVVEQPEIKKEEIKENKEVKRVEKESKMESIKPEKVRISYFEEEDFTPEKELKKEDQKKIYGDDASKLYDTISYQPDGYVKPYSTTSSRSGFKPTPIISPIYGILDKNYKKEEVVDKKEKPSSYVSRKNADLDSVRRKAFGTLEDEIVMNNFQYEEDDEEQSIEEDQLLYDMTDNEEVVAVEKVTLADAEEYFEDLGLEYNVDYKDSRYEKATGRRTKVKPEEQVSDDALNNTQITEDNSEEDNLFDLIDSMYEDKE